MKAKQLLALGILAMMPGVVCVRAQDAPEALRETVTTALNERPFISIGSPGLREAIAACQRQTGATDAQVRDVLHGIINEFLASDQKATESKPVRGSVCALDWLGNEESVKLCARLIREKEGEVRRNAIRCYLRLTDLDLGGPIKEILDDPKQYGFTGRRAIHTELELKQGNASSRDRPREARRILNLLLGLVPQETEKANFVLLDDFLSRYDSGYRTSALRVKLLKKHLNTKALQRIEDPDPERYIPEQLALLGEGEGGD